MINNENNLKEALKERLREIFQFENEDLDFGIYRIMNYKRKEIEKFIEDELINEIKNQLELVSEEDLEKAIYNHLINFFSRYYDSGDFISKRRYGKNEKYVIPYNGEEVVLYWANKDQYYIKSTEYFRKYTFKVKGLIVNFRVIEAEEEKGNVKSSEKKFFVLNERVFDFNENKKELDIYFEYRSLTEEEKEKYKEGNTVSQDKINKETIKILQEKIPENSLARLIFKQEGEKTLIQKHLYKYTRRNTTDYFIHKDLKGFLERELDFYIKNEFLQLDDLQVLEESGYFDKLMLYLIGVRAFRNVALKIIEFLAQIENFQKKLWEKKKFVIDTHYVITLDKIKEYAGEEFLQSILEEILSNEKQKEEWKELFGIEVKDKKDLIVNEEWRKLPIDTKYFDEEFKWKLLVALTKEKDLDEILDGVLIKSENYQALNLLLNKYYEKVQTIYIDPPFNKENEADYLYKVGYKDATWATMLENRIRLGRELLNERGSIFVRCDYNGNWIVRPLMNEIFGEENFRNNIILKRYTGLPKTGGTKFEEDCEYLIYFSKDQNKVFFKQLFKEIESKWMNLSSRPSPNEKNKPIVIEGKKFYPPNFQRWALSQDTVLQLLKEGRAKIENDIIKILIDKSIVGTNWTDIPGYSTTTGFKTENSEILLKRVIESTSNEGDIILDFFLGSGTTTAVAHKLRRKWIGIEMGEHFYTVILPRMKKVLAYDKSGISKEKDVKEKYNEKMAGGFFKYHTLEQYEDALENIEFEEQDELLYELPDYFVKYMLEWETKNSNTFLNLERLKNPFNYKLKIIEDYQQKEVKADVIETFNYLLGLNVSRYKVLEDNGRKYVFVFGKKDEKDVAIVWRSMEDIDLEKDKEIIEENVKTFNPDEIYINSDTTVRGFKAIEPLIKTLMFDRR